MKKRMKLIGLILSTALLMGTFAGCSYTDTEEYVPKDTQTDTLRSTKNSNSAVSIPNLTQDLPVHGEEFSLICKYDTGKYSLKNWHVTDAKSINMDVHTKNLPDGYDVMVEHMHADISLASTSPQINGITQDSMDNSFHGNTQDGFAIDDKTSYYRTFAIEGYTDQFYQLWGYACGDFGFIDSSYERLTESHIIKVGTYAERLSVVYDLAIKRPGDKKYHSVSVKSELLIPVSQNVRKKTVERDAFD